MRFRHQEIEQFATNPTVQNKALTTTYILSFCILGALCLTGMTWTQTSAMTQLTKDRDACSFGNQVMLKQTKDMWRRMKAVQSSTPLQSGARRPRTPHYPFAKA